ncbi:unnamed protein product [Trichogramma brassicae]|uniref:Uncharacterized protein n=1 Tax=Trichogramma brassicae TaxID=86971 RepID=A0A6H5J0J8_9HYME|nr:unnamed protein product [Trichogramma brassicae]
MALAASWSGRVTTAVWGSRKGFSQRPYRFQTQLGGTIQVGPEGPAYLLLRCDLVKIFDLYIAVIGVREVAEPSSPIALSSLRPSSSGLVQALSSCSSSSPPALRRTLLTLLTESCSVGSDLRSFKISA